jgi:hypothetical protein
MPELIINGTTGHAEPHTLTVIPLALQINNPADRALFTKQGKALANFLRQNIYSGTIDEMMKSLIKAEYDDYNMRDPKHDPGAAAVATALAAFHKRLCERCEMAQQGPDGVNLSKTPQLP